MKVTGRRLIDIEVDDQTIANMVGTLFPAIVTEGINDLYKILEKLE